MPRPTASPKIAATARRAGARLLQMCRSAGTPGSDSSAEWHFDEAATIAKHLRPGDAMIAQVAYRLLVAGMAADLQTYGCTYPAAAPLERALAEFMAAHGFEFHAGTFSDFHAANVARQQTPAERTPQLHAMLKA